MMVLRGVYGAIQLELDHVFETYMETSISKQAFSKARANLNPEYIRINPDKLEEYFAGDEDRLLYKGITIIAIDGSDIALPNSKALLEHFGGAGPHKDAPTALASLAYDPLNQAVFDFQLDTYATDERELEKRHMLRLRELGLEHSLLIFDRRYPSKAFMAYMGYSFIILVRNKRNLEVDGIQTQDWIELRQQKQDYRVCVLKIKLATAETETLLTNLNQKMQTIAKAKKLYFKRWGVETAFDLLKSKLQLENFSGKSVVAIRQDFYASVFLASFANVLMSVTDEMIEQSDMGMHRKHRRKSNQNRTVAKLRRDFLELFLCKNDRKRERLYGRLCEDIAARPEEIRPDRHAPISVPRKLRFPIAKKAVLP